MTTIYKNNDHNMREQISSALTAIEAVTGALGTMSTVNDAPSDGTTYGRKNAAWVAVTGGSGAASIVKAADETRTSDVSLTDDAELLFAVAANGKYAFEFIVWYYQESATPDIKVSINGPASPTRVYWTTEYQQPSSATLSSSTTIGDAYGTARLIQTGLITPVPVGMIRITGMLQNGATAGNLALQWAQNSSSVDDVTVLAGSSVTYAEA